MPRRRSKQHSGPETKRRVGVRARSRFLPRLDTGAPMGRLRKVVIAIASAIPITFLLNSVGVFRHLELPIIDAQMHLRAAPGESDVVIVRITEADYRKDFQGKSPLD